MRKVITQSPWGDFVRLHIWNKTYERSAQGRLWHGALVPWVLLDFLAWILPVDEIEPDTFTPMMRAYRPEVCTDLWRDHT